MVNQTIIKSCTTRILTNVQYFSRLLIITNNTRTNLQETGSAFQRRKRGFLPIQTGRVADVH